MKFILASASPRRREILTQIGMEFEVMPACGEEVVHDANPAEAVMDLSRQKAEEIAGKRAAEETPEVIIGADTVVYAEGRILGKPQEEREAYAMLSMLQGSSHTVYTGVTLIVRRQDQVNVHSFYEETRVTMYPMSEKELRAYIATKEPFDKAGGYGIQGRCAIFIREICGDYNTVVGLPAARMYQELAALGIAISPKIC